MTGFLLVMLFLFLFIGGCYYGISYLRAKAEKKSVVQVIDEDIGKLTK